MIWCSRSEFHYFDKKISEDVMVAIYDLHYTYIRQFEDLISTFHSSSLFVHFKQHDNIQTVCSAHYRQAVCVILNVRVMFRLVYAHVTIRHTTASQRLSEI